MEPSQIEVGAVFRFVHDERPLRVLAHHDDVIMYDAWWPHISGWGLADLQMISKKRINYYVVTVSAVIEKAEYLRLEPLTDDEVAIHRPDLPFVAARCPAMSWPAQVPQTAAQLADRLTVAGCPDSRREVLNAAEIYVFPFGPKGGEKPGVRLKAANGAFFSRDELLHKAAAIQASHLGKVQPQGIGVYRTGLQRAIPSYYLWGNESHMHEHLAAWQARQTSEEA